MQRRNSFDCKCRLDVRSARYYVSGDGAARHPYHRAKQDTPPTRTAESKLGERPSPLARTVAPIPSGESPGICLAVAVVALRQPRRVQRRNGLHGRFAEPLRRWTRRYSSQRDEFYHAKQIRRRTAQAGRLRYPKRFFKHALSPPVVEGRRNLRELREFSGMSRRFIHCKTHLEISHAQHVARFSSRFARQLSLQNISPFKTRPKEMPQS